MFGHFSVLHPSLCCSSLLKTKPLICASFMRWNDDGVVYTKNVDGLLEGTPLNRCSRMLTQEVEEEQKQ